MGHKTLYDLDIDSVVLTFGDDSQLVDLPPRTILQAAPWLLIVDHLKVVCMVTPRIHACSQPIRTDTQTCYVSPAGSTGGDVGQYQEGRPSTSYGASPFISGEAHPRDGDSSGEFRGELCVVGGSVGSMYAGRTLEGLGC